MGRTVRIEAGVHDRRWCPVRVPWDGPAPGALAAGGALIPAQADGGELVCVLPPLAAGDVVELEPVDAGPSRRGVGMEAGSGTILITLDGWEVTRYRFDGVPARPYFWPVLAPGDIPVTRAWPMSDEVETETRDHPHHRSMYFAFGAVNGVDNWGEEPGHGRTVHRSIDEIVSGPVFGRFATTSDWTDAAGNRILTQHATITVWNTAQAGQEAPIPAELLDIGQVLHDGQPLTPEQIAEALDARKESDETLADILLERGWVSEAEITRAFAHEMGMFAAEVQEDLQAATPLRLIDVDLRLTASDGDVLFGDTKEGGLLTVRVASAMDVERGGRIENSFGGIDERECWGRAAHWCDYSGEVLGKRVGIAVLDHPDSFRHPTYWHVRDYGLMAANPFALGDYTRGAKEGSHVLRAGDSLRFRYRVVLHEGDASDADIRGRYLDFVAPAVGSMD